MHIMVMGSIPRTLEFVPGAPPSLRILDQTKLPADVVYLNCTSATEVREAIYRLAVRGAPAIGVAAAYGLCLGMWKSATGSISEFERKLNEVAADLISARPTAVNLSWAVERTRRIGMKPGGANESARERWGAMVEEAGAIEREDRETCARIGEVGKGLIRDGMGVLTHCNAGALATAGAGTALAVLYAARAASCQFRVYVDETRPLLQGARLTAFELSAAGIETCVLCDNAAASLMAAGRIGLVIVGADRIAANGDTANKIGTYGLAIVARSHQIPFYVAAPRSTFDMRLSSGYEIPIEFRPESEIRSISGMSVTPAGVSCYNPAFDVTPANLITGIVTEAGITEAVTERIREIFAI